MSGSVPYLQRVYRRDDASGSEGFPFSLPFVPELDLRFAHPVTFFVGENGSGKSTLIEAIADLCDLPVSGGGRNELAAGHGPERGSVLAGGLRAAFAARPRDGYFFRAEFLAHFASLLDERQRDEDFKEDAYGRYGGKSLHARSHGEAFLAVLRSWMTPGIFLMDEPESALSPQRQLALLARVADLAREGHSQFIIATHSAILLTFPSAEIISFDDPGLGRIPLEDTAHYQITRGILDAPERYWRHLGGGLELP